MKKLLFTGGGTAGHVTPNLALIRYFKMKGHEIHYVGTKSGIEKQLVKSEGVIYHEIEAGKLRRYFDMQNIKDSVKVLKGFIDAKKVLRKVKPDIVFSKGGFVTPPVVWAAYFKRIPTVIHESDISPGLANKLAIPFAKKICYSFPETKKYLKDKKSVFTGIPIREELKIGNKEKGKKFCKFTDNKPILLIIGGSQGAKAINETTRDILDKLLHTFNVCHICGKGEKDEKFESKKGYCQFEYIKNEIADVFMATDFAVSRAGATTLFEFLEIGIASLLIPLPKKVSRGDQILNAESFKKQGFCNVLYEEKLNSQTLYMKIIETYKRKDKIIKNIKHSGIKNGLKKTVEIIESIY